MKYTQLIFLVAVAIWSQVEAAPQPSLMKAWPSSKASAGTNRWKNYKYTKREIVDSSEEIPEELQEELMKQIAAALLIATAQNSAENDALTLKYKKALQKDQSLDAFAEELVSIYKQVTGRDVDGELPAGNSLVV